MPTIIGVNQTGGALAVSSLPIPNNAIPASGSTTLTDYARANEIYDNVELISYINGGSLLLNNGTSTLTQAQSLSFITSTNLYNVQTVGNTTIVTATGTTTTTSATDILISGMTITPVAGTYLVWFSSSGFPSQNVQDQIVSIYSGGVQVAASEVIMGRGGNQTNGVNLPVTSIARVTTAGSQAIQARWRSTSGTASLDNRTLIIFQVGVL